MPLQKNATKNAVTKCCYKKNATKNATNNAALLFNLPTHVCHPPNV